MQNGQKRSVLHEPAPHLPLTACLPPTGADSPCQGEMSRRDRGDRAGAERNEADEGAIVHGTGLPSSVTAFGRATFPLQGGRLGGAQLRIRVCPSISAGFSRHPNGMARLGAQCFQMLGGSKFRLRQDFCLRQKCLYGAKRRPPFGRDGPGEEKNLNLNAKQLRLI